MPEPTDITTAADGTTSTKPMYKQFGFWMTVAAAMLGYALTSGLVEPGTPVDKVLGFIALAFGMVGYPVMRGRAAAAK